MNNRIGIWITLVLFFLVAISDGIVRAEELEDRLGPFTPSGGILWDGEGRPDDHKVKDPGVKEFLVDTLLGYSIWWAGRLFYVRNKSSRIFDTSFSDWIDHITEAPVVDDGDGFVTNYVYHPIFGALYYLYYRNMGHSVWASALGSTLMSTLWEYTVEGLVETPSLPDLVATPGLGIPLGVMMETLSEWLIERDNVPAKMGGYVLNPLRMFIRDRKIGVLNPLTGSFVLHGPFTLTPSKSRAIDLSYPFFLESPISLGRVTARFEVLDVDRELGGQFIFYSIRLDFNSSDNLLGLYIKVPYGGVNDIRVDGEEISNGFEFSNILIGGKYLLIDSNDFSFSGGFEVVPPTAFKDNKDRLKTIVGFRRDFPLYLTNSVTLTPYVSAGVIKKGVSLLSSLGVDLVFNADRLEGDGFETRIKYGTAIGAKIPVKTSPSLFVEFNGYTFASSSRIKRTDAFLTPGVRFGKKYSPGFGVQIPLAGSSTDIANASFMVDFQARF